MALVLVGRDLGGVNERLLGVASVPRGHWGEAGQVERLMTWARRENETLRKTVFGGLYRGWERRSTKGCLHRHLVF